MENWRITYENYLLGKNVTYKKISNFLNDYRPSLLYKYREFDKHWRDIIFNGKVYMGSCDKLNDPYDSLLYVNKNNFNNLISSNKLTKNGKPLKLQEFKSYEFDDFIEGYQKYIKLTCFAEKYDILLMWSHYTDSHSGFCIEYDISVERRFLHRSNISYFSAQRG